MSEVERVSITNSQYRLLNQIRGLHQDAFYMVVCAKKDSKGYILEGAEQTFDHLLLDLYEECEISTPTRMNRLHALIKRLEPKEVDI